MARTEDRRGAYRVLVGKPGRARRRWGDNLKMNLQEVGWGHRVDWSGSG